MGADWGSVPEWVSALSDVAVAGAAGVAAWQGWKSLTAWRSEMVGRRRLELAEEVLADFYEARDVFRWVRSPASYSSESEQRPGRDKEASDTRKHRDTFYVTLKRLSDHKEFFGKLQARRYRVIATFGEEAAGPYQTLGEIHAEVAATAQTLMRMLPSVHDTEAARQQHRKFESIVWQVGDDDEIGSRIKAAIKEVEDRFRSVLTEDAGR